MYTLRHAVKYLRPSLTMGEILGVVEDFNHVFDNEDQMWDVIEELNNLPV